jgi:bifunctional non-homologous end joining protein LigD
VPSDEKGSIRLSEELVVDPDLLLAHACAHELEGLIAKHRSRPFRSGRAGDWLKIKCVQSYTFAIVGHEPSKAVPGAIGSLLLAGLKGADFVYVGSVGTGFSHQHWSELYRVSA